MARAVGGIPAAAAKARTIAEKASAVERRDGVARFGAYIRRSGGAPPGVRRRKAGTDQGTTVV